ncbi:MAG: NADH-quinone oxidoreductase subunit C, partial [Pseudomonadota bacterium]|nr:NADH-quinone oxidoreductase subunit C [Pseudomonadota bacterium]
MSEVAESTKEIAVATVVDDLTTKVGAERCTVQETADKIPTIWVPREEIQSVLRFLKDEVSEPYELLFDVSAIDERTRQHRGTQPESDFTVFYHLISLSGNSDIRIKIPLSEADSRVKSVSSIYPV